LFFLFLVVGTSAVNVLEKLVSEVTYYVLNGTLNPTSLIQLTSCLLGIYVIYIVVCHHFEVFIQDKTVNLHT